MVLLPEGGKLALNDPFQPYGFIRFRTKYYFSHVTKYDY